MIKKIRKILAFPFILMGMMCWFLSDIFEWLFGFFSNLFQSISFIIEGKDYPSETFEDNNIKYR